MARRRLAHGHRALLVAALAGLGIVLSTTSWATDFENGSPEGAEVARRSSDSAPQADPSWRSDLERAWFGGGRDLGSRASGLRMRALDLGADDLEAASRALIAPGAESIDPGGALVRARAAVRLTPDLPTAHMALAREQWDEGQRAPALQQVVAGLSAIPRHVEASLWLVSSLLAMLATVMVCGSVAFVVLSALRVFSHAAHDVGDLLSHDLPSFAGAALLGSLLMVPLVAGEGVFGAVLALLALGAAYGNSRQRMALLLAGLLMVVGMYPVVQVAGRALDALDADPVATAVLQVTRDMASPAEIERLQAEESDDVLAAHALAIHARRTGRDEEAFERYTALRERLPRDPVVLANLGNLYFRQGDLATAVDLYQRASQLDASPRLLFNLSQAYARLFRMDEFEKTLQLAQRTDSEQVEELSRRGDPDFVADLPLPLSEVRMRLVSASRGERFGRALSGKIAPGWLGSSWMHAAGGLLAAMLLGALAGGRYDHSSRCARCGVRICARCDGTVWNSDTCEGCHVLFHRPEATDAALRMARLTALRTREVRIARLSLLASLFVPGVSGLLARRPDLAFVGLLFAAWAAVAVVWRHGVVPDPLAVGAAGPLTFALTGAIAFSGYLVVVVWSWLIRRSL